MSLTSGYTQLEYIESTGTGTFTAGPRTIGTHKVLINGTEYEVKGGRCLVNGVGYSVKKGRTLINGTSFEVLFEKPKPESKLTWVFNQTVTVSTTAVEWYVNFTSNGKEFKTIEAALFSGISRVRYKNKKGNTYLLAYQSSWINGEVYRTITFDEEPTGDLLTWLQANATPQ